MATKKTTPVKKGKKKKPSRKWLVFKYGSFLILLMIVLVVLLYGAVYIGIFGPLPAKSDLEAIKNEESSLILASDGTLIGKVFAQNRTNIGWEDIPKHLINALVSTEDKRYFTHQGVDGRSYARVFVKSILLGDRSAGGGSTLSQQLIKNLYGRDNHSFLSMPVNKIRESIIATRLEEVYSKEDILLLYFNSVPFGEDVFGIEVAANRYFGKRTSQLNIQESAVLVGLLKANTYYSPRLHPENALNRRNQILALMEGEGYLTQTQTDSLREIPLGLKYSNLQLDAPAGYFVHQVKKQAQEILSDLKDQNQEYDLEKDGLRVYTTLNFDLQKMAEAAVKKQLTAMQPLLDKQLKLSKAREIWLKTQPDSIKKTAANSKPHPVEIVTSDGIKTQEMSHVDSLWYYTSLLQAAVLITDPVSGEVLTWIGGNNFRFLPYDQVLAKRQAASTFKPIMYTAALEEGYTPCTYLENIQKSYPEYDGWSPENYDHTSSEDNRVALWYALANSMNLPTVDLYFKVGHEALLNLCNRLDVDIPNRETPSLALGTAGLSLLDMVKVYSTFANKGKYTEEFNIIQKIEDANGLVLWQQPDVKTRQAINPEITDELTAMLQTAVNSGTGTRLRTTYGLQSDLAGKTGTAQNYTDAWFMAFTPNLVVGVRVGASDPSIHFNNGLGSGSALALPIAGATLQGIERNSKLRAEYLVPFRIYTDSSSVCPAFREAGVEGFLNRLFGKDIDADQEKEQTLKKKEGKDDKPRSKVGRFFDRLFKGKKK
ncbi:MAG: transglycosylase domain-containing protein [Bacteroidales bacterium]|jgi:penicillin-binding protein 1A